MTQSAPPQAPPQSGQGGKELSIPGFGLGMGAIKFKPGYYLIGENFDARYGGPGPREAIDLTGIATGFRVISWCKHVDVPVVATTNGTDTKIYQRLASTWGLLATLANRKALPNGLISFKNVLAIALTTNADAAVAYQFSSNITTDGTAYTFTASTKTAANSTKAIVFIAQVNGLTAPKVIYAVLPNEIYFTEDLTNGDGTGSTASYIGPQPSNANGTYSDYITNLVEDYTGEVLICLRHDIYSMDSGGKVWRRTWEEFPDGISDAGGQSDRPNFELAIKSNGRIYFNYAGYEILEWHRGDINKYFAPKNIANGLIPRLELPINAMCAAGGYIILAIGIKDTTKKSVTYAPGGSAQLSSTINATSEIYFGRYEEDVFVWHGSLLTCTDALRFMWFDDDSSYVYLASGDLESADLQQRRFLFYTQSPLSVITSSIINLNTGTWKVDPGRIDFDSPFDLKYIESIFLHCFGLGVPTLQVLYKLTSDYDNSAFTSWEIFSNNLRAEIGSVFPEQARSGFRTMHLQFNGVGDSSGNTYAILDEATLRVKSFPERHKSRLR